MLKNPKCSTSKNDITTNVEETNKIVAIISQEIRIEEALAIMSLVTNAKPRRIFLT